MSKEKKSTAIVLAAGQGKRMGTKVQKQFLDLCGKPVLWYSLQAFETSAWVDEMILVTGEDLISYCKEEIVEKYGFRKVQAVVAGGTERYHSVYQGLQAISDVEQRIVFIHDGARMFVDESILKRGYENVEIFGACVAGMPSKDTIKLIDENQFAVNTPPRKLVWAVQTPQIFKTDLIENAYTKLMKNVIIGLDSKLCARSACLPMTYGRGA